VPRRGSKWCLYGQCVSRTCQVCNSDAAAKARRFVRNRTEVEIDLAYAEAVTERQKLAILTEELRQLFATIDKLRGAESSFSLLESLLKEARVKMVELADLQDKLFDLQDQFGTREEKHN
jgi:hypothetical protein